MTTPAAAPRSTTSYELIWVGTARAAKATGMSWARITSAAASAKCSDANRRSYAITTPFACSPLPVTYRATPSAQRRTFSNVKSSAIRARQPSVPKTIGDFGASVVAGASVTAIVPSASLAVLPFSHARNERLDRLATRCGALEEGHRALGEDIAGSARQGQAARGALDDEVVRSRLRGLVRCHDAARPGAADGAQELRPRTEVVPSDISRRHGGASVARRALHHRPVDRDGPQAVIGRLEPGLAPGDRADHRDQPRVPIDGVSDRSPLPDEDSRVPAHAELRIELSRAGHVRLLLEALELVGVDAVDACRNLQVRDEVPVLGRRMDRLHADRHERRLDTERPDPREAFRGRKDAPVDRIVIRLDPGVGRQDEHHLGGIPLEPERREGDRGGGVAAVRLRDDVDTRQLLADHRSVS